MELNVLIFGIIVFLISGMLQGLSGFGFSILAVPLITLIIPPRTAVPILMLYSIIINLVVLYSTRKSVDLKKIWILLAAGIVGLPFGAHLLVILDSSILKIFIGGVIIVFGLLLLMGYRKTLKHEKITMIPIGIFSGLLSGSISISGPPIIIFLANQDLGKHSFRGNLAIYFFLLNIFTIPVFWLNGLFTEDVMHYSLRFLPGLLVGVILGNLFSHKVQEQHFRKFTLVLLLIMGVLAVISGLR
ncbi:MAG: sulfite exporter TauE/SafE family protein [Candidatus Cloacimonetes bacterium]|nr:sulfite exporter TauE/SafE family protein [Candidatus Cloacimonadota bacterium]MCF7813108.1 sulfite exporter TauE/SafE family protein [Candidatus Cloacimonadota bacterium]MCF7867556.1 sulfite exporter TauE/SafE family protein [Candidatus Cloacimonadota bacterium]MCF7883050.1 sulfite exporter TauE/SafE family protein [Candidatus Cloacimonadota bacterium]